MAGVNTYKKRNELVEKSLGLVVSRVKRLNGGRNDDDLYQEGAIGLIEAAEKYDERRGSAFTTFAVICIDSRIRRYKRGSGIIKPRQRKGRYYKAEVVSLEGNSAGGMEETAGAAEVEEEAMAKIGEDMLNERLSERERKVLKLLREEMPQVEIARLIGKSQATVWRTRVKIAKKYAEMKT